MKNIERKEVQEATSFTDIVGLYRKENYITNCIYEANFPKVLQWLKEEYKKPVLDNVERKYLSDVIRPFRKEIETISKFRNWTNDEHYIFITMKNQNWFSLPRFPKGTMYKGMKDGRHYSLEELGL